MNTSELTWQQQLKHAFTQPQALLDFLEIDNHLYSNAATLDFPFRVPLSYAENMKKGNLNDPLLKQVLPISQEFNNPTNYQADPVGDLNALKHDCLIHKYSNRILLILTGACAINCRFCFRRNFPYHEVQLTQSKQHAVVQYLIANPHIDEVILSGGDPLLLNDNRLQELIETFSQLSNIKRLRIHTRLPIVLPARITPSLIKLLNNATLPIIIVTHCNHPNELSDEVISRCLSLKQTNITLLNQSVLLNGINDTPTILKQLSEKLFTAGILPYYLHLLDKAQGTAHFEIDKNTAIQLHQTLQTQLSGYLVPKLVTEIAGQQSKTLLF